MSAETFYVAALLSFATLPFFCVMVPNSRPPHTGWLLIHLLLLLSAASTVMWSVSKGSGIREAVALSYGYLFHVLGRSVDSDGRQIVLRAVYATIIVMLLISYASVFVAVTRGDISLSLQDDEMIRDVPGYFIIPIDLVSILLLATVSAWLVGLYAPGLFVSMGLATGLLALNFSKTYLMATAAALVFGYLTVIRTALIRLLVILVSGLSIGLLLVTDNAFTRQLFWDSALVRDVLLTDPTITLDAVNASGRFAIWDYLLHKAGDGAGGLLFGSGIGSTKFLLYSNPWGGIGLASHSDYIRLLVDFGYVGMTVYAISIFLAIKYFLKQYNQNDERFVRWISLCLVMLLVYVSVGGLGYEFLNRVRTIWTVLPFLVGLHWSCTRGPSSNNAVTVPAKS